MQVQFGLGQPEKALESHQLILYEKVSDCTILQVGFILLTTICLVSIRLSILLCSHSIHYEDGCITIPQAVGSTKSFREANFERSRRTRAYWVHRYVACDSTLMHIISMRCS